MAIKISGNTIIDNSRNVTNANTFTATTFVGDASGITGIPGPDAVLKPVNTSPADGATGIGISGANTVLCGSQYYSLYDKTHTCSCFQVSLCSDFSTCNVFTCEIAGACTSLTINPQADGLLESTQHFFRLRYEDDDGCCSEFSNPTCFNTGSYFGDIGDALCGGFYAGTICAAGTCYYLILSPNATGCTCACLWRTTCPSPCAISTVDGYDNTYTYLLGSSFPAGNWTRTRSINGFSDWYLPSINELSVIRDTGGMPAGEGFFSGSCYWSSTDCTVFCASGLCIFNGTVCRIPVSSIVTRQRAIRRVPFP